MCVFVFFFFQAEDGIRDLVRSRGLGDVYKRQGWACTYDCELYLDGSLIGPGTSAVVTRYSITLTPGDHKFAVKQRSAGTGAYFYFLSLIHI